MRIVLGLGAIGLLAADLILRVSPNGSGIIAPGASYYATVAGGLTAALGVVGATLPLLGRVTELRNVRTE